jgi:YfiH family protein
LSVIEAQSLRLPHLSHGFFGRQGGVSRGIFASLNCGYGSGDDQAAVRQNRTRAMARLDRTENDLLTLYQVHSADVVTVTARWSLAERPKADGMVTKTPGIALGILAADCGPILFADTENAIIGAAHAGWKGALTGVAEATLAAMEALGSRRSNIAAAVGPCISGESYEVGPEFKDRFLEADGANALFFRPSEKPRHHYFDLPRYVIERLRRSGVKSVESIGECTYLNPDHYFSYRRATHRRETDYGRNLSAIVLKA